VERWNRVQSWRDREGFLRAELEMMTCVYTHTHTHKHMYVCICIFQEVKAPRFQDNRHIKVVRLSALRTGRLYSPRNIPGTDFCYRLSQPQGHSATGRIMSMTNSHDSIGNRTRDLQACSTVPQPTAPPRTPHIYIYIHTHIYTHTYLLSYLLL
jgi:hypothetical protein